MTTLGKVLAEAVGVKDCFDDLFQNRLLSDGIYDVSNVECLFLKMSFTDIFPEPVNESEWAKKQTEYWEKYFVNWPDKEERAKRAVKFYTKELNLKLSYLPAIEVFLKKHKDIFCIGQAYEVRGITYLLSAVPPKYTGKVYGSGFNYGTASMFDFSDMEMPPKKLLILAEND